MNTPDKQRLSKHTDRRWRKPMTRLKTTHLYIKEGLIPLLQRHQRVCDLGTNISPQWNGWKGFTGAEEINPQAGPRKASKTKRSILNPIKLTGRQHSETKTRLKLPVLLAPDGQSAQRLWMSHKQESGARLIPTYSEILIIRDDERHGQGVDFFFFLYK